MIALAETTSPIAGVVLFYVVAAMTLAGAIGVALSSNIVRTAISLLFCLLGVAGVYFCLAAEFLAAVQLVIYVGGTLILIIFGVMLTHAHPHNEWKVGRGEWIVAGVASGLMFVALVTSMLRLPHATTPSMATETYRVDQVGVALLDTYLLPFELISVLLLVVMIGAAYLAKGRGKIGGAVATAVPAVSASAFAVPPDKEPAETAAATSVEVDR